VSDGTVQVEQALIGALLLRNDLLPLIAKKVTEEHFAEPIHAQIFDICEKLISAGKLANALTIKPLLPADVQLVQDVTLSQYVARLMAAGATASEAPHLAGMVRDLSDKRLILDVCNELARPGDADPAEIAAWGIEQLDGIVASRNTQQMPSLTLGDSVMRAIDAAASAYERDGAISGMSYGLRDLDRKTSGLQRGELTILAGRPGMMKSGLALNMARALCQGGHRGIYFSLEMGDVSLSRRLISDAVFDEREIPYFKMRSGRFKEDEFEAMRRAGQTLEELPLRIEQQTGLTLSQIASRARQMKQRGGLDFIMVDHMGLVAASDRYRGNKVNEVGEVSSGLMRLSREMDIGVIALAQLNRGVESRDDKRPNLSDLRASGNIEEDAAMVMMVYRESYYLQNREPKPDSPEYAIWQDQMARCLNTLDILIEKSREGSTGGVKVFVDVPCNAVRDEGWTRGYVPAENLPEFTF